MPPKSLAGIPYSRGAAEELFDNISQTITYVMRIKRIFVDIRRSSM